jgi:hypothetical protein
MFGFGRMPRLHIADAKESYRFDAANGRGAVLQEFRGWGRPRAVLGPPTSGQECRGLAESEGEQARTKQHETGCGYREEAFGDEVIVKHDAPADRDAGPNLLKFSESFLLQHRPRTIAFKSVREKNAGADEAEKPCNHLDHRNCP